MAGKTIIQHISDRHTSLRIPRLSNDDSVIYVLNTQRSSYLLVSFRRDFKLSNSFCNAPILSGLIIREQWSCRRLGSCLQEPFVMYVCINLTALQPGGTTIMQYIPQRRQRRLPFTYLNNLRGMNCRCVWMSSSQLLALLPHQFDYKTPCSLWSAAISANTYSKQPHPLRTQWQPQPPFATFFGLPCSLLLFRQLLVQSIPLCATRNHRSAVSRTVHVDLLSGGCLSLLTVRSGSAKLYASHIVSSYS